MSSVPEIIDLFVITRCVFFIAIWQCSVLYQINSIWQKFHVLFTHFRNQSSLVWELKTQKCRLLLYFFRWIHGVLWPKTLYYSLIILVMRHFIFRLGKSVCLKFTYSGWFNPTFIFYFNNFEWFVRFNMIYIDYCFIFLVIFFILMLLLKLILRVLSILVGITFLLHFILYFG